MNLTKLGFKDSEITEHPKTVVKNKVIDVIMSSEYVHFKNNSVSNLINNFSNIYRCKESTKELETLYEHKLNEFENN